MMEGLTLSIPQRMILLRTGVLLSFIVNIVLSWPLWAGQRYFPRVPIIRHIHLLPPYDWVLPVLLILLLALAIISVYKRFFMCLAILVVMYLIAGDIGRLQLWVFVYSAVLLLFVFYDGRVDDSNKFTSHFIVIQLLLAAVYFYSGLHRYNDSFVNQVMPEIFSGLRSFLSFRQFNLLLSIAKGIPFLLVFIGLGLIVSPARYLAIALAVLMHLALFFLLWPSEHQQNYALWFSNLSFVFFIVVLFSGKTKQRYYSPTFLFQLPGFYLVVIFALLTPVINLFGGNWPDVLSFNEKSGREKKVILFTGGTTLNKIGFYEKNFYHADNGHYYLDYEKWFEQELKSQCLTEWPVFVAMYDHILTVSDSAVSETSIEAFDGKSSFANH